MGHPHVSAGLILLALAAGLAAMLLPWWVVVIACIVAAAPAYLLARRIQAALPRRARVGAESLPGESAVVVARADSATGLPYVVRVDGELWSADSPEPLAVGERALVLGVERNHLVVCRMPPELEG